MTDPSTSSGPPSPLDDLAELADVVALEEMLNPPAVSGERPAPSRRPRVAVTFDDAYRGAVTIAQDELTRHGFPSTLFVAPGLLGDLLVGRRRLRA